MKTARHNWFVIFVGVAAWLHSSWTFATVIGGASPIVFGQPIDAGLVVRWLYWFGPASAAAAAIDVGMINLAEQFKLGSGTRARLVTFASLAVISYLGQASFALSHGSGFEASPGLHEASIKVAGFIWELLIWLLPAALPTTLILWAWADTQPEAHREPLSVEKPPISRRQRIKPSVEKALTVTSPIALCPHCGWTQTYPDASWASKGLQMHLERDCKALLTANVD